MAPAEPAAIIPENETDRLSALKGYAVLDTAPEESFDRITRIAAAFLDVPIAFVTFIESERVWFKSTVGVDLSECSRGGSFCAMTITQSSPVVVRDATRDPRFDSNPFVVGSAGIRFYAGAPLRTAQGLNLGTLCVFDTKPRDLSKQKINILKDLAALVVDELELRRAMAKALDASENRFRDIVASVPGIVFQYRMEFGGQRSFSYVSPMIERSLGIAAEDMVNDPDVWFGAIHPDDRPALEASIEKSRETLEPWQWEGRGLAPSGEFGWFRGSSVPRRLSDGSVLWNGLLLDITAQKEAEGRLEQAQKMEAVGQLTGGVAHDFNNLLAVIQGNAELLAADLGGENDYLKSIIHSSERGAELTHRLLAFSRQQPLRPRTIDLEALVASMSELLRRTLGETIEIVLECAPDLWPATADPAQLENSLLNLALNARGAMPNGGRLTIGCENMRRKTGATRPSAEAAKGEFAVISVRDTGNGMAEEVMARAFEPFYTTNEVGEGSGLGLSMVYGFIEQSGGFVTLESRVGRGTKVVLHLPRARVVDGGRDEDPESREPRGKDECVLLIEDDGDVRALVVAMLKGLGYRVVDVLDAGAAKAVFEDGQRIDLVLSDVVLPGGVSGPAIAAEFENLDPRVRIVFMSGYPANGGDPDIAPERILLTKPFKRAQLAQALREALDG